MQQLTVWAGRVSDIMTRDFSKSNITTCCLEVFAKFTGMNAKSTKYARTQFYSTISTKTVQKENTEQSQITIHKHKYQRVSTLDSSIRVPKFQKKGIIFIWPQRKSIYQSKQIIFVTWFLSHTFFWLHTLNLFPSGTNLPFNQPPWNYSRPVRKPERRDFIIEPDWDSKYKGN